VTVSGLPKIKQIDGRWAQICAVSQAGEVFCWGRNDNYQILPPKHAYVFENGSLNTPNELPLFGVSEPF
jgi:alpha-tubulin suppressor-like RCC1 family protein